MTGFLLLAVAVVSCVGGSAPLDDFARAMYAKGGQVVSRCRLSEVQGLSVPVAQKLFRTSSQMKWNGRSLSFRSDRGLSAGFCGYDAITAVGFAPPYFGDRRMMAGVLWDRDGADGWVFFRELVLYPDGYLASRWMRDARRDSSVLVFEAEEGEFLLLRFPAAAKGATALELKVDPRRTFASFGKVASDNIRGINHAYKVKVLPAYDERRDETLFDVEIGERNVFVCICPGRYRPAERVKSETLLATYGRFRTDATRPFDFVRNPSGKLDDALRGFQSAPSVTVSRGGRVWVGWHTGDETEGDANCVMVATSGDGGKSWSRPLFALDCDGPLRALDVGLWTRPDGRVELFYSQVFGFWDGRGGVFTTSPDDPEREDAVWSPPRRLCDGYLKNKPLVTAAGPWLYPVEFMTSEPKGGRLGAFTELPSEVVFTNHLARAAHVYVSTDAGKTLSELGRAAIDAEVLDYTEHMLYQRESGVLMMLVRTKYGIGRAESSDGGRTWGRVAPSGIQNPSSRFYVGRLRSGALLLVKNGPMEERGVREKIMAFVSDDDGVSWKGGLVLDERQWTSYPDAAEGPNGEIHVVHDRERFGAREIVHHVFSEADVRAGRPVSALCRLKDVVNKAGSRTVPVIEKRKSVEEHGFTVRMKVDCTNVTHSERLAEIPDVLTVSLRMASEKSGYDRGGGNYVNFPLPDGSCPVIEAVIGGSAGTVGIPLGCLKNPFGVKDVALQYANAHWSMRVDERLDDDMPPVPHIKGWPLYTGLKLLSPRAVSATFDAPANEGALGAPPASKAIMRPIQYWTPDDHNAWVGDVSLGVWRGQFHLFYLFDRRHHGGGGGRGAHFFAHLSSSDLVHWCEHPPATEVSEYWETHGTGTPFEKDGKLCLAYGLHTTRVVPYEQTTGDSLKQYFFSHGLTTGLFRMDEMKGVPYGATYAESEDGIHFRKSRMMYHSDQNPSVYNLEDGSYLLVTDNWMCKGRRFGEFKIWDSSHRAHGDCPCWFKWNEREYLIQGNEWLDSSPDGTPGTFEDWASAGYDIGDGLSVPMVTNWRGRRIMAGWLRHHYGWGGWLVFRELIQYPDGKLGTKWLREVSEGLPVETFRCAARTSFSLPFESVDGKSRFVFSVDPVRRKAQISNVAADGRVVDVPTTADFHRDPQLIQKLPDMNAVGVGAYRACSGYVFAISEVRGLDMDYVVRLIQHYDAKSNCTLFDFEIAGQRTMICRRLGKFKAEHVVSKIWGVESAWHE